MNEHQASEKQPTKTDQVDTERLSLETQISHLASGQRTEELAGLEKAAYQRFMSALLARDG